MAIPALATLLLGLIAYVVDANQTFGLASSRSAPQ
jgi:hypothetical protein